MLVDHKAENLVGNKDLRLSIQEVNNGLIFNNNNNIVNICGFFSCC